ncbi:MAG TPA: response regulator transcription factor [Candidatus Aquilonibacter sp.]|nr:response regulator transcription factor [Candidatus Aquilonibacter sp.]
MSNKNKILLVDDHPLVREWLANLINQELQFEVCGETGSAREALQLIASTQPASVIVDISLEGGSGIELIKDIKAAYPGVAAIVLSMHDEALYAERAMRAGARSYIMKREATDKVLDAIKSVLEGKTYFSNAVNATMAQKLARGAMNTPDSPVADLSDRELEVFDLLGHGCNTRQISDQLNLSFKTVQVYCARIKEKLNLANINELITQAVRWHESQHVK